MNKVIFYILLSWLSSFFLQAEISHHAFKDVIHFFKDKHDSPLIGKAALKAGIIYKLRFFGDFKSGYKWIDNGERQEYALDDPDLFWSFYSFYFLPQKESLHPKVKKRVTLAQK